MKHNSLVIVLSILCVVLSGHLYAQEDPQPSATPMPDAATPEVLRFDISGFTVEGATLLSKAEIDAAVSPYVGNSKDFSDVQRALEAVEELYAHHGFSAVQILLPEQELEKGAVMFKAVEGRFGKITVRDNNFVSEANAVNALPSLRSGGVPSSKQIARELKLANENPARQLNVVLKTGDKDDEVDASILVTDSKPTAWGVTFDNSGSKETGNTRLGVSYRNANLFDKDHVAVVQFQTSPVHPDRVKVVGGSYKIPRYESGDSLEIFGGYSNVNSLVGGLDNFQGGGLMISARDNKTLERFAGFDPQISFGFDWRTFSELKQTQPATSILYNKIVATPLNLTLSASKKAKTSDTSFNLSYSLNVPLMSSGKKADFAAYDPGGFLKPDARYSVLRYGASYAQLVGNDWQLRAAMNGQKTGNVLILGEQMRLGGADGVRGFAEGAEGGESGVKANLEAYTPSTQLWVYQGRALVFYDAGKVSSANGSSSSIASAGVGLRATSSDQLALRVDAGWIQKAGIDPLYRKGDRHIHASMSLSF